MKFKLNPLTGEFDYTSESANKQKLNPLTGEFNLVEGDGPFSQIFNPLTGTFNLGTRGGGGIITEVTGNGYINLTNAVAHRLMELKAYGGTEQRNIIPSGYTQVEYLGSSGAQYIDTGYALTTDNFEIIGSGAKKQDAGAFFGARNSTAPYTGIIESRISNSLISFWAGGSWMGFSALQNTKYNFKIVCSSNLDCVASCSDFADKSFTATQTYVNGSNIYLFGNNPFTSSSAVDIYSFSIKDNGVLVRNFIPCRRNSDNVLGMYDTVTGNFLTNKGTGTFTAGSDVIPTPAAPMDIVSNNGVIKVSKNLYNPATAQEGYLTDTGGFTPSVQGATSVFIQVKPSTTYTLKFTRTAQEIYTRVCSYSGASESDFLTLLVKNTTVTAGDITSTFTTDATAHYIRISFKIDSTNVQLEEGSTATAYMPYGQIYTDGTTETIEIHGKNLFDGQWQSGIYNTASGTYSPAANRISNVDMIQVKPSTNYTVSCPSYELQNGMRWLFYDANKNFISALTNGATTITTPSNAKYINFYIANNLTVATAPDLQLEEGSTATDYKPYFNGGTATAEMLLKVGDYKDEQEILSGNITRNVGIKVLDGTESWNMYTVTQGTLFRTQIADSASNAKDVLGVLCNYYAIVGSSLRTHGTLTGSARNYDFINNDYTTLDTWKQYLATQYANGTPVIIVYPLENPTTETATGQQLDIQKGTNTIEITQASIDNLPLYAKYLSTNNS